jgi:hypothetical protein
MSEHHLQTWTERRRDQARIEALEAELAAVSKQADELAGAYTNALDALADAQWHASVEAAGAEAAAEATAALVAKLTLRRQRQLARAERIRERIARALASLGLKRLPTAAGMVTLTAAPPRVIVTDEEAIPPAWWVERVTLTLDKAGMRRALQAGETIEGATLSNRADTIRVRT